jgi:hypothetical protein
MTLEELVDVDRYLAPERREGVLSQAHAAMAAEGSVTLEDFVLPSALAAMLEEARAAEPAAYRRNQNYTAYLAHEAIGNEDHPTRRLHRYALSAVANDQLRPDGPLEALYRNPEFIRFVADILQEPNLYPLGDPMLGLTLTFLRNGDEHGWHFDGNEFVVSLLLQDAQEGGVFEFAPFVRSTGEPNFAMVGAIMDGDRRPLRTIRAKPGTLAIFVGKRSLHRVSSVRGTRTRIVALFSYDRVPNLVHDESIHMRTFGRSPLHA